MKKILASFLTLCLFGLNILPAFAGGCGCPCSCPEVVMRQEHLNVNKKAQANTVTITNYRKVICANNVLAVAFECKFNSKKSCAGDVVNFVIPEALYTQEGTLILPACTKVVAEITKIQRPKWFNKNARVSLLFKCIVLPDGRVMPICAKPFTKDCTLKEGPWMTTGKIVLSTVTLGIIGAGVGAGFGFIPSPTNIGVGLAAGIPAGCGIGLLAALISKGLQYKAKAGEEIFIILINDANVYN
ncbi:MAG: hypothetical protein WCY19_05325 [Candidatus Gastranaerophilaceae bacterium]